MTLILVLFTFLLIFDKKMREIPLFYMFLCKKITPLIFQEFRIHNIYKTNIRTGDGTLQVRVVCPSVPFVRSFFFVYYDTGEVAVGVFPALSSGGKQQVRVRSFVPFFLVTMILLRSLWRFFQLSLMEGNIRCASVHYFSYIEPPTFHKLS